MALLILYLEKYTLLLSMFNLKCAYFWIFLLFFLGSNVHFQAHANCSRTFHKEQKKALKAELKKSADTGKEKYTRKRNRKPRGIEGSIPFISGCTVASIFFYKIFKLPFTKKVYPSFHSICILKRGPPLV